MGMPGHFITLVSLALLFLPTISVAQNLTTGFSINNGFNASHNNVFTPSGGASIHQGALQITLDSGGNFTRLLNQSGRIMATNRFKLWEKNASSDTNSSYVVASFRSEFVINIYRHPSRNDSGEGLAFLIAPEISDPPSNSYGGWLGLTNATIDNDPSNQFFAIEFDTFKQEFDQDDNHIGFDVNSVRSKKAVSLSEFGIEISPKVAKNYTVWVEYNGDSKVMEVYMADEGKSKPSRPVISDTVDLREHVNQYSYMGFAASTGQQVEFNCVLKWELAVESLETLQTLPGKKDTKWVKIGVGIGVPLVVLLVICGIGLVYYLRKRKRRSADGAGIMGALKSLPGMPREFSYKELKKATNNFDEKMKLGQGGFGVVYRGVLPQGQIEVAVKMFSREKMKGIDDFLAELTIINRLRHKHLVRLVGWCHKNGRLLLVYDYMPNGSLDDHLFGGPGNKLSWEQRYNILSGVASALHYLHNEYDQKVVHRDLKASNIMLDSHYNARLGDFGLARALENEKTSYAELEGVAGTMGYIAPECFLIGKATRESDVFGFGAVVLEVVCGQRPWTKIGGFQFLTDWVWRLYREGRILEAVDERLGNDFADEQAERMLLLGLACSHPIASERPKTQTIVQIISGSVPVPEVPHFKPSFVWPSVGPTDISSVGKTADTTPITSSYYGSDWTPHAVSRESLGGHPPNIFSPV